MKLLLTADGSHTLFSEQFNEVYHSRHGALQEAKHVYIDNGLKCYNQSELQVLEIGFGTGLNALLTWLHAENTQTKICYTAIELHPVESAMIGQLNFPQKVEHKNAEIFFSLLHATAWGSIHHLTTYFSLHKLQVDAHTYPLTSNSYHLVYFDAFAPNHQADMWTVGIFQKIYAAMKPGGLLVTYCAKGEVQRAMKLSGFHIEKLPGPPGKREMLRGNKK